MQYVIHATRAGEPVVKHVVAGRNQAIRLRDELLAQGGFAVIGWSAQLTVERRSTEGIRAYVPVSVGASRDAQEILERLGRMVAAFRAAGETVRGYKVAAVEVSP